MCAVARKWMSYCVHVAGASTGCWRGTKGAASIMVRSCCVASLVAARGKGTPVPGVQLSLHRHASVG